MHLNLQILSFRSYHGCFCKIDKSFGEMYKLSFFNFLTICTQISYLQVRVNMSKVKWNSDLVPSQKGRVVVITGATSGIGKETARVLAGKGATVVIGARNSDKARIAIQDIKDEFPTAKVISHHLDLTSLKSVKSFASYVLNEFSKLDVLINNAGIMACPYAETEDGFEIQFGTNHLSHFALTGLLMPLLRATPNSRLVIVSSTAHKFSKINGNDLNWNERKYKTNIAYADSKISNLLFMYELISRTKDDKDAPIIAAAHPGWTSTDLQRHTGLVRVLNPLFSQGVEQGALPTLRAGFDANVKSGDFYGPSKFFELRGEPIKVESNKLSHDKAIALKVWQQSEQLTGVTF